MTGATYVMSYAPDTGVVAFSYDPNPEDQSAQPTEIGVGVLDPANSDAVPPLTWRKFDVHADTPCSVSFPDDGPKT